MSLSARIRLESPEDANSVRSINERAFPAGGEADLVDRLRLMIMPYISLVAELNGQVVGHALFTPVTVQNGNTWRAMALGPMAVLPDYQRSGIGSQLVKAGLSECLKKGEPVVFVLGHPQFYPKFGFRPAQPKGFTCEWDVPDNTFMYVELKPGSIRSRAGKVIYHPAFGEE
jgi:putative acetyltransferase